jgi:hypothetical protein
MRMDGWKLILNADATGWLLEPENPSVRYFALRDLLDLPLLDPQVQEARADVMRCGPVPRILERQQPAGYWGEPKDFYMRSKYRGTVWTMILLAELGADGNDPRLRRATDFILAASQDRQSQGFAYQSAALNGGDHHSVIPCLTGNMLFCLARLGRTEDPRVRAAIAWVLRYQRLDDGDGAAPEGWPYSVNEKCWGRHTCHMAVVKTLKGLAEIPADQRPEGTGAFIQEAAEFLFKHHIFCSSHDPSQVTMTGWLKFGFPLMWNTDALEVLWVLSRLGYRDPRMQKAVELVIRKQNEQGQWILETSWNGRTLVNLEGEGKPSKWLTLRALTALKQYYS